jgi:hypothetical protein
VACTCSYARQYGNYQILHQPHTTTIFQAAGICVTISASYCESRLVYSGVSLTQRQMTNRIPFPSVLIAQLAKVHQVAGEAYGRCGLDDYPTPHSPKSSRLTPYVHTLSVYIYSWKPSLSNAGHTMTNTVAQPVSPLLHLPSHTSPDLQDGLRI